MLFILRSLKEVRGYSILATDGELGKVDEFLFDSVEWLVRYAVVNTGNWLIGRRVLISPQSFEKPRWEDQVFPVSLTKEQVENSPDISEDEPISRQEEAELADYYSWPVYWGSDLGVGTVTTPYLPVSVGRQIIQDEDEEEGDPHLRSTKEVDRYDIQAVDGEIGHVEDFIVDDDTWAIRYIVIDTRDLLPGKNVLVAPEWINKVSWADKKVFVDLHKKTIEESPEFDPSMPVNREYEEVLYDYYGRPKYWL